MPIWPARGLPRDGVVTSRYPRRPDGYGGGFRGVVQVLADGPSDATDNLCPTGAISSEHNAVRLDRGRCVLCGRCVAERPDLFRFAASVESASVGRLGLVAPPADVDENTDAIRLRLGERVRALRRSIHIRHVDCGSDGSDEWEVAALTNPVYDVQRLGIFFTATPRHADILLITGAGTRGMIEPARRTFEAMADPRVVIAAGVDAASGGMVGETYATLGGVGDVVPVDVWVPGSPATPFGLLHGILTAVGLVRERAR